MLKLPRRKFLHLAAGTAALPAVSYFAWAQSWPSRPVRMVIGFPAGAGGDVVARLIGQWLSNRLGQPFVVDNRPGAGSNIATEAVVRASPDGHTFLVATSPNAINASLYEKLNFNFIEDITPIGGLVVVPNVFVVHPSVPARTVPEFIAFAKANPGKINMASVGNGTSSHVSGELFRMMTGVDMVHVPYRGAPPAMTDLLGGQVQVSFATTAVAVEHIKAGKLRALAVTSGVRWEGLPDIPTVGEFLPGYEASVWYGVAAPKRTPVEIVNRLNREINASFADPMIKARLADLGCVPLAGSPADFRKFIAEETEKWRTVVKFAGIKPE